MRKDNMFMAFLVSLNIYIISTLILLSRRCSSADFRYEKCVPSNCANGPSIKFPFHISGQQESYCGYPGFNLSCSEDGYPVLNDYVVGDIFYQNQSLHVYNADALTFYYPSCIPRIRNTTIPTAHFSYVNSTDLHLFSSCRKPLPEALLRYNASCRLFYNWWDLALYGKDENLRKAMEFCTRNVVAPVGLDYGDEANIGTGNVTLALRRGVVLNWTISYDCSKCENSGGRCGSDANSGFRCFCPDKPHMVRCIPVAVPGTGRSRHVRLRVVLPAVIVSTFTFLLWLLVIWRKCTLSKLLRLQKAMADDNEKGIELFLKTNGSLAPRRYKYSELKKMTKSFSENLGKGGYGSVYRGKSPDGRLVAVKILNESKGNGEEFMNEVASISRTSHINIVTLLGFCFEGSRRALIYDFMPNGSLDKFIETSSSSGGLGWEKLFEISVGVARGLEYLHRLCNMRIVHFDIKPHNILLDENFNPKISDFGLAKLCPNRSSIMSMLVARGTIGYIAPEVFCRNFGEVSHKSDVYSYGMMVLEIAGGKKNIDPMDVARSSELYFPQYIYKQLERMDVEKLDGINMEEDESQIVKRKLIIVGLWCIQTDPNNRPSMSRVLEMLECRYEFLEIPPKPYLSSPPRSPPTSWISETL